MLYSLLEWMNINSILKINMLLLYRSNSIDKRTSVGTHGDPTRVREECHR